MVLVMMSTTGSQAVAGRDYPVQRVHILLKLAEFSTKIASTL